MIRVLIAIAALVCLGGCVRTGISAADAKEAYGQQPSESKMEQELKKSGKWEEYQAIKARDAAVEAEARQNADPGAKQDPKNIQVP